MSGVYNFIDCSPNPIWFLFSVRETGQETKMYLCLFRPKYSRIDCHIYIYIYAIWAILNPSAKTSNDTLSIFSYFWFVFCCCSAFCFSSNKRSPIVESKADFVRWLIRCIIRVNFSDYFDCLHFIYGLHLRHALCIALLVVILFFWRSSDHIKMHASTWPNALCSTCVWVYVCVRARALVFSCKTTEQKKKENRKQKWKMLGSLLLTKKIELFQIRMENCSSKVFMANKM